ncbi:Uncharacterized protein FWK35_00029305, partial [Aphis craccivora]
EIKYNWVKADYLSIINALGNIQCTELFNNNEINTNTEIFYNILYFFIKKFTPTYVSYKSSFPSWFTHSYYKQSHSANIHYVENSIIFLMCILYTQPIHNTPSNLKPLNSSISICNINITFSDIFQELNTLNLNFHLARIITLRNALFPLFGKQFTSLQFIKKVIVLLSQTIVQYLKFLLFRKYEVK